MGPRARGDQLGEVRSEYIVFGDLVSHSPYVYCMTAYWVPLSKLIKDVTRAKAVNGIEIFEGNLAQLREIEMAELLSEDEESASMIAFGGRRGPHRSGSRCRGRGPIERREAGREGCLWPNVASQGRPAATQRRGRLRRESERSTPNGRAKTLCGGGGGRGYRATGTRIIDPIIY